MEETTKKVLAVMGIAVIAGGFGGLIGHDMVAPREVIKEVQVDRIVPQQVIKEVEVLKDTPETLAELDTANERLKELEDTTSRFDGVDLDRYDELVSEAIMEDGALALVEDEFEDDDFKDRLVSLLENRTWSVEDSDSDIISIRLLDNDNRVLDLEEDRDGVHGEVLGTLKVKFRDGGEDGDRHTEYFGVSFELNEGEVDSYEFL